MTRFVYRTDIMTIVLFRKHDGCQKCHKAHLDAMSVPMPRTHKLYANPAGSFFPRMRGKLGEQADEESPDIEQQALNPAAILIWTP